jgi:DNA-directed RNA polymerase specialized sigma24 family protein
VADSPEPGSGGPQEFASIRLGDLAKLPIKDRMKFVERAWCPSLTLAISSACKQGIRINHISTDVLARAVAYNLVGSVDPVDAWCNPIKKSRPRSYLDKFGPDDKLGPDDKFGPDAISSKLHSALTKPMCLKDLYTTSGLTELAKSVAFEHNDKWHPEGVNHVAADQALTAFIERHHNHVESYVRGRNRSRSVSPRDIADDAWAGAYCTYWSRKAQCRYLGLAPLLPLVCRIAFFELVNQLSTGLSKPRTSGQYQRPPAKPDRLAQSDEQKAVRERCISELPEKLSLVCLMNQDGKLHREIAEALYEEGHTETKVTDARVSQLLKVAELRIQECINRNNRIRP